MPISAPVHTEEGKAHSQFVLAAEEREEFEELLAELQADVRPQGSPQQILFDQLAESAWNLPRIRRMKAELKRPPSL
jgi:hypothetical protein